MDGISWRMSNFIYNIYIIDIPAQLKFQCSMPPECHWTIYKKHKVIDVIHLLNQIENLRQSNVNHLMMQFSYALF